MVKNSNSIAYLGPKGSYSHQAALEFCHVVPHSTLQPYNQFSTILDAVETHSSIFGILPIENSITGDVQGTFAELFCRDITIHREYYVSINHVLATKSPMNIQDISIIYSHAQGLAQCSNMLQTLNCQKIVVESTSAAAQLVKQSNATDLASISSPYATELYNLSICKQNISNYQYNRTRFLLISHNKTILLPTEINTTSLYKTTIIFELDNVSGALLNVIKEIHKIGGNMTKIESHVIPERPWEYQYYIDFITESHVDIDPIVNQTNSCKVLGTYPTYNQMDASKY